MEIPYTVQARPETGLYNAKLGIWLFLASEVMLFGGLFSAYVVLRGGSPDWPAHGSDILNVPRHEMATLLRQQAMRQQHPEILEWANAIADEFDPYIDTHDDEHE